MQLELDPENRQLVDITIEARDEELIVKCGATSRLRTAAIYLGVVEDFSPRLEKGSQRSELPYTLIGENEWLLKAGHKLGQISLRSVDSPVRKERDRGATAQRLANEVHAYFESLLPAAAQSLPETAEPTQA